ncbi:RagB/SusD family nutrient uptake outer membrane protein [Gelidibacter maritimus]|uniref:RagB/SusD family nutrient uptake outer membrane protein n=1 Tax=Gelidibacter maritimus TaxID=2761487 RepID=A0A7W2M5Y2_9FLAO|nr:RagB/SusD family nutrient uptake outer membrane protein [Gelidibacter maritimus]MBA6153096.1 RagB/SusD family nutrient uptake outer membrane protein [Gelidibacter maritimus]
MKIKHNRDIKFNKKLSMNMCNILNRWTLFFFVMFSLGCSEFVIVDAPKNLLTSDIVFKDKSTVESALANIYYKMREKGMVSGDFGLTTTMGTYSDELDYFGSDTEYQNLYHNNVMTNNTKILGWWNHAYNLVYSANDIIEGLENSETLSSSDKQIFLGQSLFVRAYIHYLLTNIFGDIPYITSTDYLENNKMSRMSISEVNSQIITDLVNATYFLKDINAIDGERVWPGYHAAMALLARMYLYNEQWELAASTATVLIDKYSLEEDVNDVFLKKSSETIWQLKPGEHPRNTQEANQLIIRNIPGQKYALSNSLLDDFEAGDLRYAKWVDSISDAENNITLYYANKYKANFGELESLEYSIIFRLAEQYLIRAEAMANLANKAAAQQDLNTIRNRAGLPPTPANTVNDLLDAILHERRVELFAEHGQRWLDLKRTGRTHETLKDLKPYWQTTDVHLPIPEAELELNRNLQPQNDGY